VGDHEVVDDVDHAGRAEAEVDREGFVKLSSDGLELVSETSRLQAVEEEVRNSFLDLTSVAERGSVYAYFVEICRETTM
jgi:hypothetical protein